ncbi:putative pentatricopeptide repeat-containing protein At3g11460, mitochondrial [Wolffia australiana]
MLSNSIVSRISWRSFTEPIHIHLLNSILKSLPASSSSLFHIHAIHCHILKTGHLNLLSATAMINSLGRSSDLGSARKLFDEMNNRDLPAWNAMLSVYDYNGDIHEAITLIKLMFSSEMNPNSVTLSILLNLCSKYEYTSLGRCVHSYSWRRPGLADTFLCNSLIVFYQKLGRVDIAESLFEEMGRRNIVSWNAMMSGYTLNNSPMKALEIFRRLNREGLRPDEVTLETAVHACACVDDDETIHAGKLMHALLFKMGFSPDIYMDNSVLLMYCKWGLLQIAQRLFNTIAVKNVVSWNILMNGFVQKCLPESAVALFRCAHSSLSKLSSELVVGALQAVKQLNPCPPHSVSCCHGLVLISGFTSDDFVISSLISAYGECMDATDAIRCMEYISHGGGSPVPLNTLLSVCLFSGHLSMSVDLLHLMQSDYHAKADAVTLVYALSICARLRDTRLGQAVHGYALRNKFEGNPFVSSSLLEFYCRCLLISKAWRLFLRTPSVTAAACNGMIFGCTLNGVPAAGLFLFHMMPQLGNCEVDATTIVGVIEAISLRGCKKEGDYIHNYAINEGLLGNEFVINALISMHRKLGDLKKAHEVFDEGSGCYQSTWNLMMAEYSNHVSAEVTVSLFQSMKFCGMTPDKISLLAVLAAIPKLASSNCAQWAHANIIKTGCDDDVFVATSLSDAYAKCGKLAAARRIFDNIKHKTTATWNCIIGAYGMSGDHEEAGKLFDKMAASGVEPDLTTFLVLISSCGHAGQVKKGLNYYDVMTRVYSLSPKREHYSCIVDLLARRGLIEEALEILEKMPQPPGKTAWGSVLGACRAKENIDVALAAADKLSQIDPFHYGYNTLLAGILSESGRWADAFQIREKIRVMGERNMHGLSVVEI